MNRYDQLEVNLAHIIRSNAGDYVSDDGIFIRREIQHRNRNLSHNPLVEIETVSYDREMLCDDSDMATVQVAIRLSSRADKSDLNDTADAIVRALKLVENLNEPVDVGAMNDWTHTTARSKIGETLMIEITLSVRLLVPVLEA